jgi:SEC-C motif-containing protein
MTCPCGKGPTLEACCGPILDGAPAQTAEELMRSRYTAYVTGNIDHVVATHDPATRDTVDREASTAWSKQSQWHGLEVRATEAGGAGDTTGVVEFIARFTLAGRSQQHHERSRFVKQDDHWYYVDGEVLKARPVEREAPKVGRNEPCPCGSGKKYKKCHGQA